MNKPKFNLDAHSILLLCNGEQVDTDAGKLQLTIVEQAEPNKPVIDLHKDSWGVLNDGSQRFKDTVVRWLNGNKRRNLEGTQIWSYYGVTKDDNVLNLPSEYYFTHILTIDEFCALAYPQNEGSELVGNWVRYCHKGYEEEEEFNKWFEIIDVKPAPENYSKCKNILFIKNDKEPFGDICFDLSNPLDYNPETLVGKYYNGYKISSIEIFEEGMPYFHFEDLNIDDVYCKDLSPSDLTDEPLVNSLKYEDCFERLTEDEKLAIIDALNGIFQLRQNNPRQANQLAATIKLTVIMNDANKGWVPEEGEPRIFPKWDKQLTWLEQYHTFVAPIYFRDEETAQRAYEANKEIFHDYFGIGGDNE